jgi:hypothetical protein
MWKVREGGMSSRACTRFGVVKTRVLRGVALVASLGFAGWIAHAVFRSFAPVASAFSGNGEIVDFGFWTYPRYRVTLPSVRAGASGTYVYSFRGLPRSEYWFGFVVADPPAGNTTEALAQAMVLGVNVRDDRGDVLCELRRPLADWVRSWSQTRTMFWHEQCRHLRMRADRTYTVTLTVESEVRDLSGITFAPVFEGGGNETP